MKDENLRPSSVRPLSRHAGAERPQVIIRTMHAVRSARYLARLVLTWFVVSLGMAAAAPVVHPGQAMERVCSGSGEMRWVPAAHGAVEAGAAARIGHHTLDCPLCLSPAPPVSPSASAAFRSPSIAHRAEPVRPQPTVALTRAPFPPRAPPAVS